MTVEERYLGSLLGLAAGDALGTTLEFEPPGSFEPITAIVGGGPFGLEPGQWTDDTSLALCLAASLAERRTFDPVDQLKRYVRWWREGYMSSTGRCFDIGNTTRDALVRFAKSGEPFCGSTHARSAGNGSLMRLAPVPLAFARDPARAVELAGESSRTTHAAAEAVSACRYYAALIVGTLGGASREELLAPGFDLGLGLWEKEPLAPGVAAVAAGSFLTKEPPEIRGSGFVVESLEAALWAFSRAESFEHGALLAVNLGDDADTTGAIYGQLAGAYYGVRAIPEAWLEKLALRAEIESLATKLYELAHDNVSTGTARSSEPRWQRPQAQSGRPNGDTYWVREGQLLAGEYPGSTDAKVARDSVETFLRAGVTYFVDLTEEGERASYAEILAEAPTRLGVSAVYRRLPIRDVSVPRSPAEMEEILDTIDDAIGSGHTVYVHCRGGVGRTGTVVGCHLVRHGLGGDEALGELAKLWQKVERSSRQPESPETDEQRDFVRRWERRCRPTGSPGSGAGRTP
jgi:ADP-ribosyl-[dinitrogen reductase] hydrolase